MGRSFRICLKASQRLLEISHFYDHAWLSSVLLAELMADFLRPIPQENVLFAAGGADGGFPAAHAGVRAGAARHCPGDAESPLAEGARHGADRAGQRGFRPDCSSR